MSRNNSGRMGGEMRLSPQVLTRSHARKQRWGGQREGKHLAFNLSQGKTSKSWKREPHDEKFPSCNPLDWNRGANASTPFFFFDRGKLAGDFGWALSQFTLQSQNPKDFAGKPSHNLIENSQGELNLPLSPSLASVYVTTKTCSVW